MVFAAIGHIKEAEIPSKKVTYLAVVSDLDEGEFNTIPCY